MGLLDQIRARNGVGGLLGGFFGEDDDDPAGSAGAAPKAEDPYRYLPTAVRHLSGYLDDSLGAYNKKATGLEQEEERRGSTAAGMVANAAAKANVPTLTDKEIRRQFTLKSDAASDQTLDAMAALREYQGMSGVTGGGVIGAAVGQIAGAQLAATIGARSDLAGLKATTDALDRQKAYDRELDVAAAVNRPVSMLGLDAMTNTLETRVAQSGVYAGYSGAKQQADAAEKAGKDSFLGSVIGGGMGLIGSLI